MTRTAIRSHSFKMESLFRECVVIVAFSLSDQDPVDT